MNFLDPSQIKHYLGTLKRDSSSTSSFFEIISFNDFDIHLSAGPGGFSEPTVKFDSLLHYTHLGVSIYEVIKQDTYAITPKADSRFKYFSWAKYFIFVNAKGKITDSYMGNRIPLDEAIQLIREVYKTSRLKMFF